MKIPWNKSIFLLLLVKEICSVVISSSKNRLPMSLTPVIQDLEAEGVTSLSTATILSSKSVTKKDYESILNHLFKNTDSEDSESEEVDMKTRAFGKKYILEDTVGEDEVIGIVIANPTKEEVRKSVLATHGSIIYLISNVDLIERNGEGLFTSFGPAIEGLLMQQQYKPSELIVVFLKNDYDFNECKEKFMGYVKELLKTTPSSSDDASTKTLEDLFHSIEFLSESSLLENDNELYQKLSKSNHLLSSPEEASQDIYKSIEVTANDQTTTFAKTLCGRKSAQDVATYRILYPMTKQIIKTALLNIQSQTGGTIVPPDEEEEEEEDIKLVPNFGSLIQASISSCTLQYQEQIQPLKSILSKSIIQQQQNLLINTLLNELQTMYQRQMSLLSSTYFELFRKNLSSLRLGPTLPHDMEEARLKSCTEFKEALQNMSVSNYVNPSSFLSQFQRRTREYSKERLLAARVSGNYREPPRKGVAIGMHWLLPKPFGNDFRLAGSDVYRGNIVYDSSKKIMEVEPSDISHSGDWRKCVSPMPSGAEMMYQSSSGN